MSDEEFRTAGRQLARMIRELDELTVAHTTVKAEQKAERERLAEKIASRRRDTASASPPSRM